MYETILCDDEYLEMMNTIDNIHFIDNGKWDWEHGHKHAVMVSKYVMNILNDLQADNHTIELGMVAGLIHDIGLVNGHKQGHAAYGAKLAQTFLAKHNFNQKDIDIIVEAIESHSEGTNINNLVGLALVLADKIDLSKHRVSSSTINDEINTEFAKIENVSISINKQELIVEYVTKNDFNAHILKNWNKSITVPIKIAQHLNKSFVFMINNKIFNAIELL